MALKWVSLEEELKKNKGLKKEDLENLLDWNTKQPHLPDLSIEHLVLFLQSCYFNNEAAKNAIETFFTIRTDAPEIFQIGNKVIDNVKDVLLITPLPPTPENYHVLYSRLFDSSLDKYDPPLCMSYLDMVSNLALMQNGTAEGHVLVVDAAGTSLGHAMKLNLLLAKKFITYLQEGLPVRVKSIHVINTMSFVEKVLQMFKYIIRQDILDALHLHSKMETLYPFVPKKNLPQELGGEAGTFLELRDRGILNVQQNEAFFKELNKLVIDDSKRLPTSRDEKIMEGTFKRLEID